MAKKGLEIEVAVAEVVDFLRMTGRFSHALREVVSRKVAVAAAKKMRLSVTTAQLQKASDTFRIMHNLNKASDTNNWLKANGLTVEALEEYLETNLLINQLKDALEKKTAKGKYLASPIIKETLREMIYKDWLEKELKK
ncbi:MAG: hypothetical protein JW932_10345 [Deltaproteobacteria bacterium]|nr:hypothetical protein [Deltaproteobacteria bacterium]